jgi:translocation and assembly module TamA
LATDSERYELIGSLTQAMGDWQRVLSITLNQETTGFPDGTSREDLLLIPGFSYSSLPPNFFTGWMRDAAYYFELTGSPSTLGSDASYLRFYSRIERVWPISGPWYVRLRGEFGTSWVDEFSELPASQRFFAGGTQRARFRARRLSPIERLSRHRAGIACGEAATRSSARWNSSATCRATRVAFFYDTGNAFTDWSCRSSIRSERPAGACHDADRPRRRAGAGSGKSPRLHLNITQVL